MQSFSMFHHFMFALTKRTWAPNIDGNYPPKRCGPKIKACAGGYG
jgi:hypothetical protein